MAVPAEALTQFTTPKEDFCANTRTLHAGDTLLRDDLLAALFGAAYTRRAQVDGPGQSSVRAILWIFLLPTRKCRFVWNFGVMRSIPCTPLT